MTYRPEIDGVRALAVVPVVLFHAGFRGFEAGFIGVDVFFVISGFLITTILVSDLERGRFSLRRFYERRARRILPALFTVMIVTIPFAWSWMGPSQFREFAQVLIGTSLFVSNFVLWRQSDYFGAPADEKPLLHTWSLGVEEQFYAVFPIFCWIVWRFGRANFILPIATIALVSFAVGEWGWRNEPTANFYLPFTRAWELLAGALCALIWRHGAPRPMDWPALIGLALIGASLVIYSERTPFPSVFTILPVAGTCLILLFAGHGTWTARMLAAPPLVGIGLVSYGFYLWHQPLFALARVGGGFASGGWAMGALAVLALGLAYLTWRFIENPVRARQSVFGRRHVVAASAIGIAVFAALGGTWSYTISQGYFRFAKIPYSGPLIDVDDAQRASWARFLRNDTWRERLSRFPEPAAEPSVNLLVAGDSHAKDTFNALFANRDRFPNTNFRHAELNFDCIYETKAIPLVGSIHDCIARFAEHNRQLLREAEIVLLSARWWDGIGVNAYLPTYIRFFRNKGVQPVLSGNAPEFFPPVPALMRQRLRQDGGALSKSRLDRALYTHLERRLLDHNAPLIRLADRTGIPYLSKLAYSCTAAERRCHAVTPDMSPIYYDKSHYTVAGAKYFGRRMARTDWLAPIFKAEDR